MLDTNHLDPVGSMNSMIENHPIYGRIEKEELIACPCGDRVHASKLTYVEKEGALCPTCYSLWKLDNL